MSLTILAWALIGSGAKPGGLHLSEVYDEWTNRAWDARGIRMRQYEESPPLNKERKRKWHFLGLEFLITGFSMFAATDSDPEFDDYNTCAARVDDGPIQLPGLMVWDSTGSLTLSADVDRSKRYHTVQVCEAPRGSWKTVISWRLSDPEWQRSGISFGPPNRSSIGDEWTVSGDSKPVLKSVYRAGCTLVVRPRAEMSSEDFRFVVLDKAGRFLEATNCCLGEPEHTFLLSTKPNRIASVVFQTRNYDWTTLAHVPGKPNG